MAVNTRTTRLPLVGGALLLAGVLIGGAYVLADPAHSPFAAKTVNAADTQSILASYASKDTDNDGLPDWQESLYGTDINNPHSISSTLTDGEAVAQGLVQPKFTSSISETDQNSPDAIPGITPDEDSLTAQFSRDFFQSYLDASNGQQLSSADEQTLITSLMSDFTARAKALVASPYTLVAVHTSQNISAKTYAGNVEAILVKHDVTEGNADPVLLMDALIDKNDETARTKLQTLANSYSAIATDLAALSVPTELANDHLQLMQSFDTLARATNIVVNYEKDPVAVLGALSVYQPKSQSFVDGIQGIAEAVLATGEPAAGQPGALIVSISRAAQTP